MRGLPSSGTNERSPTAPRSAPPCPAGSLALGVMSGAVSGPKAERYLEFAANMTQACFQLYNVTASGGWAGGAGGGKDAWSAEGNSSRTTAHATPAGAQAWAPSASRLPARPTPAAPTSWSPTSTTSSGPRSAAPGAWRVGCACSAVGQRQGPAWKARRHLLAACAAPPPHRPPPAPTPPPGARSSSPSFTCGAPRTTTSGGTWGGRCGAR